MKYDFYFRKLLKILTISIIISVLVLGPITVGSNQAFGSALRCTATLDGNQEVPPVVTDTTGEAIFLINEAMDKINYQLFVFDGFAITQSHFHVAQEGFNGPVTAFLFGFVPEGVNVDGLLEEGMLTDGDIIPTGPVNNLLTLIAEMNSGGIYVNVHSVNHPPGEVRGQISCMPITSVGGELLPLDSTALILAGAQMNAAWMIPVIVSGIGFAIVIARKF